MDLHFASVGKYFPYPFYLGVVSAMRTQNVDGVNVWATEEPEGEYFARLKPYVSVRAIEKPDFPALNGKSEHFTAAQCKDYIEWKVLFEHGGLFMDLDTFSLKDITYLLYPEDREVVASPYRLYDYNAAGVSINPFEGAIVVAKPGATIVSEALEATEYALSQNDVAYGYTGPIVYNNAIQRHFDLVKFAPLGTFGDVLVNPGQIVSAYKKDGVLNPQTHVYHLYASVYKNTYYNIDKNYIADGETLLAKLVQVVLPREDWDV